jgi:hypothetical protein
MIISHKHKIIFLKTAKVAGTSFEIALSKFCTEQDILTPVYPIEDESFREKLFNKKPINYKITLKDFFNFGPKRNHIHDLMNCRYPSKFYNHISASEIKKYIDQRIWNKYTKISIVRNPYTRVVSLYKWYMRNDKNPININEFIEKNISLLNHNSNITNINGKSVIDFYIQYEFFRRDIRRLEREIKSLSGLYDTFSNINLKSGKFIEFDNINLNQKSKLLINRECHNDIKKFGYEYDF